ncbi:MAG: hypothetical protein U9M94_02540 [Patescibacteria group bacterium]|nr:hypothetical protein [Patescibacteria group bacterium]
MKLIFSKNYIKDYNKLPQHLQKIIGKQLKFLLANPWHPSLGTKKIKGFIGIFEGRVSKSCRFTFYIDGNRLTLRRVGDNDKTLKKP